MATKSSNHNLTKNKLIKPIIPKVPNYSNYQELHELDEGVINDPNFYKYSEKHPLIWEEIRDIMLKYRGVIDLNTLAEELEEDPKFIKHTLDVWVLSWCSFFEYGRVGYDSTQGKWFYIKNTHPQARFHRPRVKFSLE